MTTQYIFDASGFLTGIYQGQVIQENSTIISPIYVEGLTPQFINGQWIKQGISPAVSPITFKMLWSSQERVAIKTLRATDAIVDDFMGLVNDPQLTEVVMSLESVQNAIWYTLGALAAAGVIAPEDIAVRHAAIVSGVLQ